MLEARDDKLLLRLQKQLAKQDLLDEIGYLPVSRDGAVLFFQLINARHERASTVLISNKGFEDWGRVLGDDVMAAALVRFHTPLVEPDWRLSRIRLSDKDYAFAHGKLPRRLSKRISPNVS